MAVNKYFNNYNHTQSQSMVEDIVIEAIKMAGVDCYYIPKKLNNFNNILGEDCLKSFDSKMMIETFIENTDGFEGEGDFISKFGLEIRDSMDVIISKKRFGELSLEYGINLSRPTEGDLFYFPFNKNLFEIKFVEHEQPFYQLGKNYIYSLKLELFTYSYEDMETNTEIIDNIEDLFQNNDSTENDNYGNNDSFDDEINEIMNFDEVNPIGDFNNDV
jgi:hypothetical protein